MAYDIQQSLDIKEYENNNKTFSRNIYIKIQRYSFTVFLESSLVLQYHFNDNGFHKDMKVVLP